MERQWPSCLLYWKQQDLFYIFSHMIPKNNEVLQLMLKKEIPKFMLRNSFHVCISGNSIDF